MDNLTKNIDDNSTTSSVDPKNIAGAFAEAMENFADKVKNGDIKTAEQLADGLKSFDRIIGKSTDIMDLVDAIYSDDPRYEIPKALTKMFGSKMTAAAIAGIGVSFATAVGLSAVLTGIAVFVGAGLGAYYGSELIDMFYDELFKKGGFFDRNITDERFYGDFPGFDIEVENVDENSGEVEVSIRLRKKCEKDVVVELIYESGSAKNGEDFVAHSKTVVIKASDENNVHLAVSDFINIIDDALIEGDEKFVIKARLVNTQDFFEPTSAEEDGLEYYDYKIVNIKDDDAPVTLTITEHASANEGDGVVAFVLNLSRALDEDLTLNVTIDKVLGENEYLILQTHGSNILFGTLPKELESVYGELNKNGIKFTYSNLEQTTKFNYVNLLNLERVA